MKIKPFYDYRVFYSMPSLIMSDDIADQVAHTLYI